MLEQYWERFSKHPRAPWLITGILSLFTLLTLIHLVGSLMLPAGLDAAATRVSSPMASQLTVDLSSFHLFGIYDANLANLPETQLQLTLEGTEVSTDKTGAAFAIIAAQGGEAKNYKVGDLVAGQATIHQILKDRVILEQNGNLEMLKLPVPKLGASK